MKMNNTKLLLNTHVILLSLFVTYNFVYVIQEVFLLYLQGYKNIENSQSDIILIVT